MQPKVSVIVPAFNVEAFLPRCLNSLLEQTLCPLEIIVIDDASTDKTPQIISMYAERYPNIIFKTIEKSGQGIGRNLGMKMATGKYIGFVDADDGAEKTMFEELFNLAEETQSDIAFCHAKCIDENRKEIAYTYYDNEKKHFKKYPEKVSFSHREIVPHLSNMTVVAWNKIYRRDFIEQHQLTFGDGIIHEDIPFFYRCFVAAKKVSLIRKSLYRYTANRQGSTTNAVMSTSPRMLEIFDETESAIAPFLNEEEIAQQFYHFKATQLISFINYAFQRHILSNFTKKRFFLLTKQSFAQIPVAYLDGLAREEKRIFYSVKKGKLGVLRWIKFRDIVRYHLKDPKRIKPLLIWGWRLFWGSLGYYWYKFMRQMRSWYYKFIHKFKTEDDGV